MGQMSLRALFKGHQRLSQGELIQGMSVETRVRKDGVGGFLPENLSCTQQTESFPEASVMRLSPHNDS